MLKEKKVAKACMTNESRPFVSSFVKSQMVNSSEYGPVLFYILCTLTQWHRE